MPMNVDSSMKNNNIFAPKSKAPKSGMKDTIPARQNVKDPVSAQNNVSSMSVFKLQNDGIKQPKLSEKAQKLLDKLRDQYGDKMDFMIFDKGQDPKDMLPNATKEYAVFFSVDEIEKMAADENYEKENMDKIMSAVDMADQIMDKFKDDPEKAGMIQRIGISFNSDGTVSMFADLEKMTEQQSERLEKIRQKHAEDKKAAQKADEQDKKELREAAAAEKRRAEHPRSQTVKRMTVEASTMEELIEKINGVNWDDTQEELMLTGKKFSMKA